MASQLVIWDRVRDSFNDDVEDALAIRYGAPGYLAVLAETVAGHTTELTALEPLAPAGKTLYVEPDGSDTNSGYSLGTAYATIQAAVDALAGPGRVLVAAGEYAPFSVTTSGVSVESLAGPRATTIQTASLSADGVTFLGASASALDTVRQCSLKGFHVVGPGQASGGTGVGISIKWTTIDLRIEDCWISAWGSHGVKIVDAYSMSFIRTIADYNGGDGWNGATNINNVTFDRTLAILNSGRGYAVVGGTTCLFLNADAESNEGSGFDLRYVFASTLLGCHMENNGGDGTSSNIYLHHKTDLNDKAQAISILGCLVQGSSSTVRGLVIDGANHTIVQGNWFSNHVTDHVQTTSAATRTWIGPNTYQGTGAVLTDGSASTVRMDYDEANLCAITSILRYAPRTTNPAVPAQGQVWYLSTTDQLKVRDASQIRTVFSGLESAATLDFGSIAAHSTADLTIDTPGALVGDRLAIGAPALAAGLIWSAWVSATNVVTVRVANVTTGAIDPASGGWKIAVLKA